MVYTCFYQAVTSTAGMWIALIIGFFILRLLISAVYLFFMAFIFIVLLSLLII